MVYPNEHAILQESVSSISLGDLQQRSSQSSCDPTLKEEIMDMVNPFAGKGVVASALDLTLDYPDYMQLHQECFVRDVIRAYDKIKFTDLKGV
jgi:hypothetical protein